MVWEEDSDVSSFFKFVYHSFNKIFKHGILIKMHPKILKVLIEYYGFIFYKKFFSDELTRLSYNQIK
jgi:hypothetical protein